MNLFGRNRKAPITTEESFLPTDIQVAVAMEQALVASMEAIIFHKEAWNELVGRLEVMGANVQISPEASQDYCHILNRLRASLVVVAQESSINPDLITRLEIND